MSEVVFTPFLTGLCAQTARFRQDHFLPRKCHRGERSHALFSVASSIAARSDGMCCRDAGPCTDDVCRSGADDHLRTGRPVDRYGDPVSVTVSMLLSGGEPGGL